MSNSIVIKQGDTLQLSGVYKQPNQSPMNLTGYTLEANILNSDGYVVLTINSNSANPNRTLSIISAIDGTFQLLMKDTEVLTSEEDYWLDIKTISISGIEQTSKAVKLKVKNRLV